MRDDARWLDLVSEMQALVYEQAWLHELTNAVVDYEADGPVVHGPWTTDECRAVLRPWLAAGWIQLIADVEPARGLAPAVWQPHTRREGLYYFLQPDDAAALLNDPTRWRPTTADGHVMLDRTEKSEDQDLAAWLALAGSP